MSHAMSEGRDTEETEVHAKSLRCNYAWRVSKDLVAWSRVSKQEGWSMDRVAWRMHKGRRISSQTGREPP